MERGQLVAWTEGDVEDLGRTLQALVKYTETANKAINDLQKRVKVLEARTSSNTVGYS